MVERIIDFNDLDSGAVIDNQFAADGVSISSVANVDRGDNGAAMAFDTENVTGGDRDLGFDGQGSALIISEDNDSSDADDDRGGGIVTFDFDEPSDLTSIKILDGEEGGTIRAFDEVGNLIGEIEISEGENNDARTFDLGFANAAKLEVELNGSGAIDDLVFDVPDDGDGSGEGDDPETVVVEEEGETQDGTDVTFGVGAPETTDDGTATVEASLTLGVGGDVNNIAFVIDNSGSTGFLFVGDVSVGDVNGDSQADSLLDAEIASLLGLSDAIADQGLDPSLVEIGLISFESDADFLGTFEPGEEALSQALTSLQVEGGTDYEAAFQAVLDFFDGQSAGGDTNIVYFLSDGFPNFQNFDDEVQALEDNFDAEIIAVGVGSFADIDTLNEIDNTGGAQQVLSPEDLQAEILTGSLGASVADFMIFVNGVEDPDIDEDDLISTPFGFELPPTEIEGLDPTDGVDNDVTARLELSDGTEFELTAIIQGNAFVLEDPGLV